MEFQSPETTLAPIPATRSFVPWFVGVRVTVAFEVEKATSPVGVKFV
jgi:hypothetical protein